MKTIVSIALLCAVSVVCLPPGADARGNREIRDDSLVPDHTLPDPLVMSDGTRVADAETWRNRRRPEILALFEEHVYGRSPEGPEDLNVTVISHSPDALGGTAVRKQVRVRFRPGTEGPFMDILLFIPKDRTGPAPAFMGLNFYGNHTVLDDPEIMLSEKWMRPNSRMGVVDNRATEASRGLAARRWPLDTIIGRGYAVATIYCGDIDPDHHDGFRNGVHALYPGPGPADWGTIGAWAWGLSRAMDYLETDGDIDHGRVAVMGHSRLGKTALWAGATDERFALVISNNSGCGGAALSRRRFGETVDMINTNFPHWFCDNFIRYNGNEDALPVDQHMLVALIAPRPVYVASAEEDLHADPRGEFLSAYHAAPVYRLLGTDGIAAEEMPPVNEPVMSTIGCHVRTGGHDVTDFDWGCFLDFADRHMR